MADVPVVGSPYDFDLTKNARNQCVQLSPARFAKLQYNFVIRSARWSGGAERAL